MRDFDLADSTAVSAIVLNAKLKQYAPLRGAFDEVRTAAECCGVVSV